MPVNWNSCCEYRGRFLYASTLMHAWHAYPPDIFPALYGRLKDVFPGRVLVLKQILDEVIFTEEFNGFGVLKAWLHSIPLKPVHFDVRDEKLLQLSRDFEIDSNRKGASHNDISLIAYAREHQYTVVTEASNQSLPLVVVPITGFHLSVRS